MPPLPSLQPPLLPLLAPGRARSGLALRQAWGRAFPLPLSPLLTPALLHPVPALPQVFVPLGILTGVQGVTWTKFFMVRGPPCPLLQRRRCEAAREEQGGKQRAA